MSAPICACDPRPDLVYLGICSECGGAQLDAMAEAERKILQNVATVGETILTGGRHLQLVKRDDP